MTWAVRYEEVTKRYRGGAYGYASLRDDIGRLGRALGWRRANRVRNDSRPALDRLSFEVAEGEAFALVGPNGAGKTTALRLLARILYPTAGRIRVRGRVGALIEVGSGIHPELTGRENIWLYGRIMGMSRQKVERRFDEIVGFAELEHALDLPVKQYSTGMQLRLGFAIASHLDPDVFVVDEALAVGDTGFQAKCVDRMTRLTKEGRTLLFVSHDLYAIEAICPRGVYLNRGETVAMGAIKDVLTRYLDDVDDHRFAGRVASSERIRSGPLSISVKCKGPNGSPIVRTGDTLTIVCDVSCTHPGLRAYFHIGISDGRPGVPLLLASQIVEGQAPVTLGRDDTVECKILDLPLLPRVYEVWGEIRGEQRWGSIVDWQKLTEFRVVRDDQGSHSSVSHEGVDAPVRVKFHYRHEKTELTSSLI